MKNIIDVNNLNYKSVVNFNILLVIVGSVIGLLLGGGIATIITLIALSIVNGLMNSVAIEDNYKYKKQFFIFTVIVQLVAIFLALKFASLNNQKADLYWLIGFGYLGLIVLSMKILGMWKSNYNAFNLSEITSYLNPKTLLKGNKWTKFNDIKNELNGTVYIDNFRIVEDREKRIGKSTLEAEKIDLKFKLKDFTKTLLAIGKMGSGKTEFFLNLVN